MDARQLKTNLENLGLSQVAFFESVGSTNDVVAGWAEDGASPPALAAADEQTAGRGRHGRRWHTPPGSALAFSLLLDPRLAERHLGRAPGLGGLAVCLALEREFGLAPAIKWPNDVLLEGKKVCGVLAEAHWSGERLLALILGIGINVAPPSVPPAEALSFPATCIEAVLNRSVDRAALLRAVAEQVLAWQDRLGSANFLAAWGQRLAYQGQRVTLATSDAAPSLSAELQGLAPDGSLIVHLEDGSTRQLAAGEITMRPAAN